MSSNDNNILNEENLVGSKDKKPKKKINQSNSNENENVAIDIKDKTTNDVTVDYNLNINLPDNFKSKKQFVIFKNQMEAYVNNNVYILKECKENKRLLDLEYDDLSNKINYIQISVIFLSTVSG
ncbi:unnamed protein product, partial [marine sediment metagenome]